MTETYLEVIRIVSRSDLNYARTKVHFNIVIGYDRYLTVYDRQYNCLADESRVTLVLGIYCNSGIAEECLGTCCGKLQIAVAVLYLIAEMPEMTCLILICYFSV